MARVAILMLLAAVLAASEAPRVLATTYPMWLLTRMAGAPRLQPTLLLGAGLGCPHDYALTPQDLAKVARAEVLVANGLGLEEFLGAPLAAANPRLQVIDAGVAVPAAELLAGGDEEAGHADHRPGAARNPHLFASPRQAARIVRFLAGELARLDPDGADAYRSNAAAAGQRLDRLADEMKTALAAVPARRVVVQHDVFGYLARDCGLTVVAELQEHPGNDPSAAALAALVAAARTGGARAVLTEPQYPARIGEVVAREAGVALTSLDPLASGPADPPAGHYEAVMRANLAALLRVLGGKP